MNLRLKQGIILILAVVVISGLSNFLNKLGLVSFSQNAFQYTFLKNLAAAAVLSILIFRAPAQPRLKKISRLDWPKLAAVGLIGGAIPFLFFFQGLSLTSAASASFLHKTLFLWIGLLAVPILKEKISGWQLTALAGLFVGNYIFLGAGGLSFGWPEVLIILAVVCWALEAIAVKILLKGIDPLALGWARMFFGAGFLAVFLGATGNLAGLFSLTAGQFGWLMMTGGLLAGYIAGWYGALKRLPAVAAASFLTLASPLTALISSAVSGEIFGWEKIVGTAVIAAALAIFWFFRKISFYDLDFFRT